MKIIITLLLLVLIYGLIKFEPKPEPRKVYVISENDIAAYKLERETTLRMIEAKKCLKH
jgi:hypothetical protein